MPQIEPRAEYDRLAKVFHWLTFGLVIVQFAIAWIMPAVGNESQPNGLLSWHFSLGILIFMVLVLRSLWRLTYDPPSPSPSVPRWMQKIPQAVHLLLYAVLLVLPLIGWIDAASRGWSVSLFGVLPTPQIFFGRSSTTALWGDIHIALAILLLILISLHIAGVIYHQLVTKECILFRMLP
ncbi:MAG: cytochrome [Nevskia sp.]|nr:cytochrome [Nevskia sp.]